MTKPVGRRQAPAGSDLGRRLLVTLVAPVLFLFGQQLLLPGIDLSLIEQDRGDLLSFFVWRSRANVSVFALGIMPVVTAFGLVELAAAAVPRWRVLRHGGPESRAKLTTRTLWVAIALTLFQAHGVVTLMVSLSLLGPSTGAYVMAMASLTGGVFTLVVLAMLVGRHGLANGFAVLLLGPPLLDELWRVAEALAVGDRVAPLQLGTPLVLIAATMGATLLVLGLRWDRHLRRGREPFGERDRYDDEQDAAEDEAEAGVDDEDGAAPAGEPELDPYRPPADESPLEVPRAVAGVGGDPPLRLPLPAAGVAPLVLATELPARAADLAALGFDSAAVLIEWDPFDWAWWVMMLAIVLPFGWWLSRLFNDPDRVAALWARRNKQWPETRQLAQRELAAATGRTLGYLVVLVVIIVICWHLGGSFPDILYVALATALGLDVVGEWRARRAGPLIVVWEEHRPYAIDVVIATLEAKGIKAHLRGRHLRSMLQFFGPYVPIEILVRPASAARARKRLRGRLLGRQSGAGKDRDRRA